MESPALNCRLMGELSTPHSASSNGTAQTLWSHVGSQSSLQASPQCRQAREYALC